MGICRMSDTIAGTEELSLAVMQKVRFRDGVPVTTKGDKYVTQTLKEAWDGGSRGKVKTKGKRGVGFA